MLTEEILAALPGGNDPELLASFLYQAIQRNKYSNGGVVDLQNQELRLLLDKLNVVFTASSNRGVNL